jgi:hypothetical protein
MRLIQGLAVALCLAAPAVPAAAQHQDHTATGGHFPAGWHGRVDRPSQDIADVRFMAGSGYFHVKTGPHVILWNPQHAATGAYRASATFVQDRAPQRLESFGLIVGGRDLDGPGQDYLYLLIRHDGRYMIRHRAGDEVHTLANWTETPAVRRATADAAASNTVAIEAYADRVDFVVNGTVVQSLERIPMLNTDGIAGLRVGHHLELRVLDFAVEPLQ